MPRILTALFILLFAACAQDSKIKPHSENSQLERYAKGFEIHRFERGLTRIKVTAPWPGADQDFTYWLIPRGTETPDSITHTADAIIAVPVKNYIATSTTHIAALEALGVLDKLIGFPGTDYISSAYARTMIQKGAIQEIGANEALNTEMTLALRPDVVFGFSIDARNAGYQTLEEAGIPVLYNGDWTEHSPLGKAEWVRFFAPFFGLEEKADALFQDIVVEYDRAKSLAAQATYQPVVLSGALYKDIWYTPGGNSWAAQLIADANGKYLWENTKATGSLSLSIEEVLAQATEADVWIAPSQFTSKDEMLQASPHYKKFSALQRGHVYTYASMRGQTGGLIYFETAPQRPDLVLKDLIHIFHPGVLPDYKPHFFSPLE